MLTLVKIKLAIDKAGLSDVDGLNDYVINQVNNGKKIDNESVNSLIQSQNYQNIAGSLTLLFNIISQKSFI